MQLSCSAYGNRIRLVMKQRRISERNVQSMKGRQLT